MIKWVVDWAAALAYQDEIRSKSPVVWAVNMPQDYPECRVTRQGIAHIAITDDEELVEELRQDGGEVKLMT